MSGSATAPVAHSFPANFDDDSRFVRTALSSYLARSGRGYIPFDQLDTSEQSAVISTAQRMKAFSRLSPEAAQAELDRQHAAVAQKVRTLKSDIEHWNANCPIGEEIDMDFDFTAEVEAVRARAKEIEKEIAQ